MIIARLLSDPALLAVTAALTAALAAIAVWDARTLRIPDFLSLPLVAAGLAAAWMFSRLPLRDHLIGAALGYAALFLVALVYRRMRGREGLGLGDAKLLAAGGAWLGWTALPSVLLVASFTGLGHALINAVSGRRGHDGEGPRPIPFGPHICFAILLIWLTGPLAALPVWG